MSGSMATPPVRRSARVLIPSGLGGGSVPEFLRVLGLAGARIPSSDLWMIDRMSTDEEIITSRQIAGPDVKRNRFDVLAPSSELDDGLDSNAARIERAISQLHAAVADGELAAILRTVQIQLSTAQSADLVELTEAAFQQLRTMTNNVDEPVFPNCGIRSIDISSRFYSAAKFAQVMLRLRQDPLLNQELSQGRLDHTKSKPTLWFQAGDEHIRDLAVRDTFLDPLLAAIPPGVWAFSTGRLRNPYVFTLGRVIKDKPGQHLRVADIITGDPANHRTVKLPETPPSPKAWGQAVDWWCMKTNVVFTRVSDITEFVDNDDDYLPDLHLMWMMDTIETFKRVAEVSRSWHSAFGTTLTTYTALDLIAETWYGTADMAQLVEPDRVSEALARVRAAIPELLHPILLPAAEAAGRAPDLIFDGFFQSQSDDVEIVFPPVKKGSTPRRETWTKKSAIHHLVRARRNATHGFVGTPQSKPNIHTLTQHNGKLPSEFAMLPYLYLLDILCRPNELLDVAIPRSIRKFLPSTH